MRAPVLLHGGIENTWSVRCCLRADGWRRELSGGMVCSCSAAAPLTIVPVMGIASCNNVFVETLSSAASGLKIVIPFSLYLCESYWNINCVSGCSSGHSNNCIDKFNTCDWVTISVSISITS